MLMLKSQIFLDQVTKVVALLDCPEVDSLSQLERVVQQIIHGIHMLQDIGLLPQANILRPWILKQMRD